ncbi:hypothetical protein G7Z17_g3310 [Cylindrodendrum hubeiense]|uniref:C2H2-type domain-containing protein n=1 Tax=Cylindrodendrum hubeiense TaxID=595255 RepID=A0A9P5HJ57_9HYPO|nr:hypothetical protein G7Z17_g3310 [Cylindrodendrum hubeiense]
MLLVSFLLLFGASVLAHVVPAAQTFAVLFIRIQRMIGFSELPTADLTQNRTVRRRLEREQNRVAKAKQRRASSFPIANRESKEAGALSGFLSLYFLNPATNDKACSGHIADGETPPGASPLSTSPSCGNPIATHTRHPYPSPQHAGILGFAHHLLFWTGKLGGTWNTTVDIFLWVRDSLVPISCRPAGPAHQTCGISKAKRNGKGKAKGKGKEKATRKGKKYGKSTKSNDNPGDSDDEGDDDHGSHYHSDDEEAPSGRFLACPFYKLDPVRHYRCVEKYKLKRYADVRQHILRCHVLEEGFFYCTLCSESWEHSAPWEAHVTGNLCRLATAPARNLADNPLLDKLQPSEAVCLASTPRGLSDYQRWYRMWAQIFRGNEAPDSPYVENGIAEPQRLFARGGAAALLMALPALLRRYSLQLNEAATTSFAGDISAIYGGAMSAMPQGSFRQLGFHTGGSPQQVLPSPGNPPDPHRQAPLPGGPQIQMPGEFPANVPLAPAPDLRILQEALDYTGPAVPDLDYTGPAMPDLDFGDMDFLDDEPGAA